MSKEQQELLDEVYENYRNSYPDAEKTFQYEKSTFETRRMTKDEFIDMVKSDVEYGRRWGLKIEERELRYEERIKLYEEKTNLSTTYILSVKETLDKHNVPTKLITITYKDTKIESYE
jgi:hypothetical protein